MTVEQQPQTERSLIRYRLQVSRPPSRVNGEGDGPVIVATEPGRLLDDEDGTSEMSSYAINRQGVAYRIDKYWYLDEKEVIRDSSRYQSATTILGTNAQFHCDLGTDQNGQRTHLYYLEYDADPSLDSELL